MKGIVILISLF